MIATKFIQTVSVVFVVSVLASPCMAGQTKPKKTEEEQLREDAVNSISQAGTGRTPIMGKFSLAPDEVASDTPLPKVIGYISDKGGGGYPVMVATKSLVNLLTSYDRKDVTLMGKILDKGDKGKWLVVDEIAVSPAGPVIRRKKGGL